MVLEGAPSARLVPAVFIDSNEPKYRLKDDVSAMEYWNAYVPFTSV